MFKLRELDKDVEKLKIKNEEDCIFLKFLTHNS